MNKYYSLLLKLFSLILAITLITFTVNSAYPGKSIDKIAYVVAIGFDTSDTCNFKITIQLAKPNGAGSQSSGSSSQSVETVLNSVECLSFESGINLLNSYISRDINLSHCKAIIISEEIASNGISQIIYDLSNNAEVSSHANVIITKCDAFDYLQMASPILENFSARYYTIIDSSSNNTASTVSIPLIDFFNHMEDSCIEPVATLGNINLDSTHLIDSETKDDANKDMSYLAGQSPITSSNKVETKGVAVFKDDRFIGELTGLECICHKIISGNLNYCSLQIPNPLEGNQNINLVIKLSRKPKINLEIINGFPYVKLDIKLSIRVISIEKDSDFTSEETRKLLETSFNSYMESTILNYLYKTSKEFNSDIDGFGYSALKYFSTTKDWNEYKWLNNYKNSFFSVNVDSKIIAGNSFLGI